MKIRSFSTEQFAGIGEVRKEFCDGMNVVCGDNETGKSTMISAIYYALTKAVKLDRRSDSAFMEQMFPTSAADTIDASIDFSENGSDYRLEKIWDRNGRDYSVRLKTTDKGLLRGEQAEKELKELLRYGPAVYSNLIFGRQNHEQEILNWCYGFFSAKTKEDVEETRKTVVQALSAVQGISPEVFADELEQAMKDLGEHWDFRNDRPMAPPRGKMRWSSGIGSILSACYALEDAEKNLQEAENIERSMEETTNEILSLREKRKELETERDFLNTKKGAVSERAAREKLLLDRKTKKKKAEDAAEKWPEIRDLLAEAIELSAAEKEKSQRDQKETAERRWHRAKELAEQVAALQKEIGTYPNIQNDAQEAKKISNDIFRTKTKLTAVSLHAEIRLEDGYRAEISSASGRTEAVSGQNVDAEGFFRMEIPGVAAVQVAPAGTDVEELTSRLSDLQEKRTSILSVYGTESEETLQDLCGRLSEQKSALAACRREFDTVVSGLTVEELAEEAGKIPTNPALVIPEDLVKRKSALLLKTGKATLDSAAGTLETVLQSYEKEYEGETELKRYLENLSAEIREMTDEAAQDQSGILMSVEELENRIKGILGELSDLDGKLEELRMVLGRLSAAERTDSAELENEIEEKRQIWLHEKQKYAAYEEIQKDFEKLREEAGNRFDGFYEKFNEYLSLLTVGRLSRSEDPDSLVLQSGKNDIPIQDLLSEGTKKTVLLAFRLAVLHFFFPQGGGLIVLDDELLDMDPGRREQAAALLNAFAENNQVIFTTCDPAIARILGGNLISMKD